MYDIDIKKLKNQGKVYYIIVVFGFIFFIVGSAFFVSNTIKSHSMDSKIEATKIEIKTHTDSEGETMFLPVYYYNVSGKEYVCASNISSGSYPDTENGIVYYDSKNPSNCLTDFSKSNGNLILIIFGGVGLLVMGIGFVQVVKHNKRVNVIKQLNDSGKLVKNLPYTLEASNMVANGVPLLRPVVNYVLPGGNTIKLYGDPRTDRKNYDADGFVDLVIDEMNIENYFIDFEINRLTGNLDSDYYKPKDGVSAIPYYQMNQNINNHLPPQI